MNKNSVRKFWGTLGVALSAVASAHAQAAATTTTTPAAAPASSTDTTVQMTSFVVTGSYLPPASLVGANPVTVIDGTRISSTGVDNVLQLLKKLDVSFTGNGNIGTELDNGGAGESNVALRNLTTLVLLDGQRMVSSPFSNGTAVDLNTIPLAMIERIEVLKDGASTVYGSDAIGGVVNVITKKNFNGAEIYGGYGSAKGGSYIDKTAGMVVGVSNDTTMVTVGADYYTNSALKATDRPFAVASLAAIASHGVIPANTGASYYSGSFQGRVNNDVLAGSPLAVGAPGYNASINTPVIKTNANQAGLTLAQLEAAGIYIPFATAPADIIAGGPTAYNTALFGTGVIVPTDRRQFLANGEHKVFGDSLVFDTNLMYTETINAGSILAPSPLAGVGANNLSIPANNPYNPFGTIIGVGQPAGSPTVRTRLVDLGNRGSTNTTDTYHAVAGLKGKINDDYSWNVSGNYSRASTTQLVYGGANGAVMNALLIPQVNADGTYVKNAAGKILSTFVNPATGAADLPVFNYFAAVPGLNDPATINAIKTNLFKNGVTELKDYRAVVNGTPFELPGGKLAFDLGYEFERQDITSAVDGLYGNGLALGYNAAKTFSGGTLYDNAGFAEVLVPITQPSMALPGAYNLSLNVSGRYEKLSTGPHSGVPKFGVKWQPLDNSLTFRATYAKGFISPALFDLYGPAVGNSPYVTVQNGNGSSGSGGGTGNLVTGQFIGSDTELSNPNLQPSKSETTTLGLIYSPKALKGLTFTADYYHIHETGIGSIDYTGDLADLNAKGSGSAFAPGFVFSDGTKLTTTAPNQVTSTNIGAFTVQKNPGGTQWTDGLDMDLDYILPTPAEYGRFSVGINGSITFDYKYRNGNLAHFNQYARQYTSSINGLGGSNGLLPGWTAKPYAEWAWKGFTANIYGDIIPSVTDSGQLFGNLSVPGATDAETINGLKYKIPEYDKWDIAVSYDFGDRMSTDTMYGTALKHLELTVGVNNVFNVHPRYVPSATENNTDKINYDPVGPFLFVQVTKKF